MGVVDTFGPGLHNFWTKLLNCGHIVGRISSIKALCLPITGKRHTKGYLQLRAAWVSRFSSTKCGFVADSFVTFFSLMELEFWNLTIFNIIRWVDGLMGQWSHQPSAWCSKYYLFFIISCKIFCKDPFNLFLYFYFNLFFHFYKNNNKEFWVP